MTCLLPALAGIDARTLGERIRDARRRAGVSQEELGQAVGIERTAVKDLSGTLSAAFGCP
ncbi:helix-turn-helix transcriptional regulator [Streptomyces sp. NPDC019224]|uniref:helix-turn-helix transcriptional regulator n=1 Tax=Streptomyces sp. NPDC019224 TaxID=3154484 RepID=UPI0033ECA425